MAGIADFIRSVVVSHRCGESDTGLLTRFINDRDETAFTALIRRHGPMVYRVCWGVLRNEADAEDATQAAFLVLAQKANGVRNRDSLPSWLHGIALRTARKLRTSIARRRVGLAYLPPSASGDDLTVREASTLLHDCPCPRSTG